MINTFAQIDYAASGGRTLWHRASALGKLLLAALVVLLAVFAPAWPPLLVLLALAVVLAATAGLAWRLIVASATAPLLFATLFVLARWSGDRAELALLVLRPVVASVIALWLVGSTPYPDLFAPLSRILPRAIGDGLFLTYRSVFVLLARIERLWRALFLRGALTGPLPRRAGLMGEAVGTVVLSGFERSQRLYQTMLLRGHSGRICGCRHYLEFTRADLGVLAAALAALGAFLPWYRGLL